MKFIHIKQEDIREYQEAVYVETIEGMISKAFY
jgi:hypothetical protein